ncbi:hypothetical protein Acr_23g0009020 [Actinidia rufa]|uniref:Uncharacterized protein n=1 Tax=Actinidia rufa TaxID=165716 RepID=A0A7J0GNX3_9ERIC|nr:hypothetical protein Acr_23g0009020 [Actinidia rufa]
MTKKGKCDSNVASWDLIETLVVQSKDLVQEISLPADGVISNVTVDDAGDIASAVPSLECAAWRNKQLLFKSQTRCGGVVAAEVNVSKLGVLSRAAIKHGWPSGDAQGNVSSTSSGAFDQRNSFKKWRDAKVVLESQVAPSHAAMCRWLSKYPQLLFIKSSRLEMTDHKLNSSIMKGMPTFKWKGATHEVQGSGSSLDTCFTQSKAVKEMHRDRSSKMLPNGAPSGPPASSVVKPNDQCHDSPRPNDVSLGAPISGASFVEGTEKPRVNSSSTRTEVVPPRSSSSTSKLNPGAKVFCPSFANHRSVTPPAVPTVANVAYVPDFPVVPVQQEAEISQFVPRSSLPVKLVPYGNLIAGNGVIDSQYSQSIIGHVGSRAQSHRYAGQHHSIQAGPAYMHPNSQNVVVGRLGQLVYMHPVSHDMNQGVAVLSQVSTRPLLTPHQGHLPKHQGQNTTEYGALFKHSA